MSLEELKREADSMMALTTWLITRGLGQSDAHQEVYARRLRENTPAGGNVFEALQSEEDDFIKAVLINKFRELHEAGHADELIARLEYYRQAYYELSPQAEGIESHYVSSERMLTTGIATATERFAILLYSFNIAADQTALNKQQRFALANESDHLPILLAKISVTDESRFIRMINDYDFTTTALVKIIERENSHQAIIDPRIIYKMRELYPEEKPEYAHRAHLGCPASVSFNGHSSSAISELWRMTVGAMEKYGNVWGEQASAEPATTGFIAGPDAEE